MKGLAKFAALAPVAIAWTVQAADHVWVIGGGPEPDGSQAQIELNVNWVLEVLGQRVPAAQKHVYYADGVGPVRDVKTWAVPPENKAALQPLARVFGEETANGNGYRKHRVPGVEASTEAGPLKSRLEAGFAKLRQGDRALLVYNGHGSFDGKDPAGNALRLWKDTRLSAREMEALLGRVPASVPVRFVFTQCYSGAFTRLVHPQASDVLALAPANRCGFTATSESRESEGCSDSINAGDYRDYTTFFFAALNGRTRTGGELAGNPDLNGDGRVDLREAHLYALAYANSTDLPRSTSEAFLERWQPWYLRWFDTGAEPDNTYGRLARNLARGLGLPQEGRALVAELSTRRAERARESKALLAENTRLEEDIRQLQGLLQREVKIRWPEAMHPHTLAYVNFLQRDLNDAQDFIVSHPSYRALAAIQDRLASLRLESLAVNRNATQLDKVRRLRMLARLVDQFKRHASNEERAGYERLLECERSPL